MILMIHINIFIPPIPIVIGFLIRCRLKSNKRLAFYQVSYSPHNHHRRGGTVGLHSMVLGSHPLTQNAYTAESVTYRMTMRLKVSHRIHVRLKVSDRMHMRVKVSHRMHIRLKVSHRIPMWLKVSHTECIHMRLKVSHTECMHG